MTEANNLGRTIDKIALVAAKDFKPHDATLAFEQGSTEITLHCNNLPDLVAAPKLKRHCELRKYSQKAKTWFGLLISPGSGTLRSGLMLDYPWVVDAQLDKAVENMPEASTSRKFQAFAQTWSEYRKRSSVEMSAAPVAAASNTECCLHKTERDLPHWTPRSSPRPRCPHS